ncbi:ribonuclease H-like protein [Panus rudis PR-1116 ss-1]|nr:ribonuclease H-like protein [Panus rudis PR-1116 ss-1]
MQSQHPQPAPSSTHPSDAIPQSSNRRNKPNKPPPSKQGPTTDKLYSWRELSPNAQRHYIRDAAQATSAIAQLKGAAYGFDLEWKPNYVKGTPQNPVALVQIADDKDILLLQVSAMNEFPAALQAFLQNPNIVKAGVGIQYDCKKLWTDYNVNCRNFVDLALLARSVDNARWKGRWSDPIGLSRLCEHYFQAALSKGRVQRSDWSAYLKDNQVEYAANDCHSGFMLYKRLMRMLPFVTPVPQRIYFTFDCMYGYLYEPSIDQPAKLWQPHNPFYDPGPLPEPKPKDESQTSTSPIASSSTAGPPTMAMNANIAPQVQRDARPYHNNARRPPPRRRRPTSGANGQQQNSSEPRRRENRNRRRKDERSSAPSPDTAS